MGGGSYAERAAQHRPGSPLSDPGGGVGAPLHACPSVGELTSLCSLACSALARYGMNRIHAEDCASP